MTTTPCSTESSRRSRERQPPPTPGAHDDGVEPRARTGDTGKSTSGDAVDAARAPATENAEKPVATPASAAAGGVKRPPRTEHRRLLPPGRLLLLLCLAALLFIFVTVTPTTRWVSGTGYIMTDQEVEVRASVEGAIAAWLVPSGEQVEQGQLVMQLASAVQKAAYEQAASELQAKRGQLQQLRMSQELERARRQEQIFQAQRSLALAQSQADRMVPGSGFSTREIEDAQLRVELAASRLSELELPYDPLMAQQIEVLAEEIRSVEKALALRKAELEMRDIRASISGTIYFNRFEPGEFVKPEHVLGQIFDRSQWVAKIKVSERQIGSLRMGAPATVKIAAYPSIRYGQFEARVSRIIPVITPRATGDGIFYVEVALDTPPPGIELHPGMTATGYVDGGRTTWLLRLAGW